MNPLTELTFVDFRISKLNFSLNGQFNNQGQAKIRTEFKIRHELGGQRLKVFLTIIFNDKTAPFSIDLEGAGLFELGQTFSEDELDNLCNSHCSMVMFPYLREVIADITRRAGFPPLHIPQINFAQVFKQQATTENVHTLH
ncbi:MAG: protein-export chaperone SecB [Deltaproteobacteria bacterium]|nr:protein-export chaperone SecB [Deltaproteobacteria bacterium]